jgi:predicted Zn-dependent protease
MTAPGTPRRRRWPFHAAVGAGLALGLIYLAIEWRFASERQRAIALADKGRFAEAEPILLSLHERRPKDVPVLMALTGGMMTSGRLVAEAEPFLSKWCALEPDNPEPLRLRYDLWLRLGRRERALDDGLRLLKLEPQDDAVRRSLIGLLMAAERFDESERECRQALMRAPDDVDLLFSLAQLRYLRGQTGEALDLLDKLVANPEAPVAALVLRGQLHLESRPPDPEKAVALLRRALAAATASGAEPATRHAARYQLSQALARLGKTDEAQRVLADMQRDKDAERLVMDAGQQPDNDVLQVRAAAALLEIGQTAPALERLERVLARQPRCAAAHQLLADHYDKQGQAELAKHHRHKARE